MKPALAATGHESGYPKPRVGVSGIASSCLAVATIVDNRQLGGNPVRRLDHDSVSSLEQGLKEVQRKLRGRSPGGGEMASLWRCYHPSAMQAFVAAETAIREMLASACVSASLWVATPATPLLLLPPTSPRVAAEATACLGLTTGSGSGHLPPVRGIPHPGGPNTVLSDSGSDSRAAAWRLWPSASGQSGLLQRWARNGGTGAGDMARRARARVEESEARAQNDTANWEQDNTSSAGRAGTVAHSMRGTLKQRL